MTQIRGVYGAVDDANQPYRNNIEDIRSLIWALAGGRPGIIDGFVMTLDSGSLSVTFSPGYAVIEESGVDSTGDARGYYLFNDVDTVVAFDAPSAGSRCDALVLAWADPQYGNDIVSHASVDAPGPQIVVVKGASGSTTPRTDAQITTAVGPGGWLRLADVVIAPGDTQVNPANVSSNAKATVIADTDWTDIPLPSGFTGTLQWRYRHGFMFLRIDGSATTQSGVTFTLGIAGRIHSAHPNLGDLRPAVMVRQHGYFGGYPGTITVMTDGSITAIQNTGADRASISGTLTWPVEL